MNRRLIEERFPLKEINEICKKEKRDRFKTITTVHHWWARRPLTASRATIFASLINYSQKKSINSSNFELIKKISQDENFDYPYNFSLFDDCIGLGNTDDINTTNCMLNTFLPKRYAFWLRNTLFNHIRNILGEEIEIL